MPTDERLTPLQGWRIWMVEHVSDPHGRYCTAYLHVPDEMDTDQRRRAWILSTGIVPEGSRLSWLGPKACQQHLFDCYGVNHNTEDDTPLSGVPPYPATNDSLRRLRASLNEVPRWAQPLSFERDMPDYRWEEITDPGHVREYIDSMPRDAETEYN